MKIQNLLLFLSVKGNEDSIFSSFPRYCNPESIISEKVKFLQKMFWFNLMEFAVGYFHESEMFWDAGDEIFLIRPDLLKLLNL